MPQSAISNPQSAILPSRYLMIGGFLGAGKTTAVAALAARLAATGHRVGLITNDQGSELVDTAMLRARGFPTEEIPGGCFCCRFNSLVEAAQRLDTASSPDVFLAEPVGSCTDLVATVTYPLRRIYGDHFRIAPLSVLVDPVRAERILGLVEGGGRFSEKVLYIYRKQLEEADILVLTKIDTIDSDRRHRLREHLRRLYPRAVILCVSARHGAGMDAWLDCLLHNEQEPRPAMSVDYGIYAEGEALLGWLNATVGLTAPGGFDSDALLHLLARDIERRLAGAEIAHLKMTLSPGGALPGLAVINLVRSDLVPELSLRLEAPVTAGQLILNLRAEADPALLRDAVRAALRELPATLPGVLVTLEHLEYFRPGKPVPTHRDAGEGEG